MKNFLSALFIMIMAGSCAPRIYTSNEFDSITAKHKMVALLPADVSMTLRPNELKNTSEEQMRRYVEETAYSVQDNMQTWFLRRSGKKKYTVSIQDISKTNALLKQSGIRYADLGSLTKDSLARLLKVDAVLTTKVVMRKPMSDGAAVAMGLLVGMWGNTNDVQTSISIHESVKGDMVWKYDYNATGSVGSNTQRLVDALMRNASRRFPYREK